jgi:hypothetical protein
MSAPTTEQCDVCKNKRCHCKGCRGTKRNGIDLWCGGTCTWGDDASCFDQYNKDKPDWEPGRFNQMIGK